jgi:hypothetical protein
VLLLVLLEGTCVITFLTNNEAMTLESRFQNFSLSPILFLSYSYRVKNKKIKN